MPDKMNHASSLTTLPGLGKSLGSLPLWAVVLLEVVLLAAAYLVSGKLGLLLAIPPGYASAVWPPSGIALAGLLLFGYRAWPGVLLGSFLVNVGISFDTSTQAAILKSLSIAAGIGAGAALQAAAGVYLIRRAVGYPNALDRERDIAWFMFLAGPVSCLVSATVGVSTLWMHGLIPSSVYLFSWWTWWVGDVIGVLIFTPLILIFLATPRAVWRPRRLSVAVPLLATFALTVLIFVLVSGQEQRRIEAVFEQRVERMTQGLNNAIGDYVQILYAIESFYASSQVVERDEFRAYVQRALHTYPGIQALGWNPRVPAGERAAYETRARREGHVRFQFTELDADGRLVRAAPRAEYLPAYYLEPHAGNAVALGYDVGSNAERRATLDRARDTGRPTATASLHLVQESEQERGFLIFLPIYARSPVPETVGARRLALRGYVVGVFRMDHVVDAALKQLDRSGFVVRIEDSASAGDQRRVYGPPVEAGAPARVWRTTLDIAGRPWALSFTPTPEYLAAQRSWAAWLVLAAGLFFSALLGAFLLMLTGRTSRIEQLVVDRTAELQRSNQDLEQFAYVASHDLQEPLRMVTSYTQLLAKRYRGRLDQDADEFIAFAVDGVTRMQRLIQDLLAYSRVGTSGQELTLIDSGQCLQVALANLKIAIEESRATVTHEPLPTLNIDASQVAQLFQNLIGNAIKFQGEAAPTVHVSALRLRSGQEWLFSVRDNGIGIEPQYKDRVFVIFQRLHTRVAYSGTGIGLAVCKRIVERHGGRIWVESQAGQGATFFFTVPIAMETGR